MDWYFGFIGLFVGSFLNVLIDRLPKGQQVIWGRSHCDHCRRTLEWFELMPVVSFLWFRGACRRCKKKLSYQYPAIELFTALGFFGIASQWFHSPLLLTGYLVLFSVLTVIFVADLKYQIIPDSMVGFGLIATVFAHFQTGGIIELLPNIVVAGASMILFYVLWYATKGRGMGFGDVKLAFLLGLFLGYPLGVMALYFAFLTGAGIGVILILLGNKTLKSKIAFGPFMIAGLAFTKVFSTELIRLWNNIW